MPQVMALTTMLASAGDFALAIPVSTSRHSSRKKMGNGARETSACGQLPAAFLTAIILDVHGAVNFSEQEKPRGG